MSGKDPELQKISYNCHWQHAFRVEDVCDARMDERLIAQSNVSRRIVHSLRVDSNVIDSRQQTTDNRQRRVQKRKDGKVTTQAKKWYRTKPELCNNWRKNRTGLERGARPIRKGKYQPFLTAPRKGEGEQETPCSRRLHGYHPFIHPPIHSSIRFLLAGLCLGTCPIYTNALISPMSVRSLLLLSSNVLPCL